jgi:hypothetical protein
MLEETLNFHAVVLKLLDFINRGLVYLGPFNGLQLFCNRVISWLLARQHINPKNKEAIYAYKNDNKDYNRVPAQLLYEACEHSWNGFKV